MGWSDFFDGSIEVVGMYGMVYVYGSDTLIIKLKVNVHIDDIFRKNVAGKWKNKGHVTNLVSSDLSTTV